MPDQRWTTPLPPAQSVANAERGGGLAVEHRQMDCIGRTGLPWLVARILRKIPGKPNSRDPKSCLAPACWDCNFRGQTIEAGIHTMALMDQGI